MVNCTTKQQLTGRSVGIPSNFTTKKQLIEFYKSDYDTKYHRPFLELALTKIGNLSDANPVKLTSDQIVKIQEKLNDDDFSNETFFDALELLTFEQICYVGW